PMLFISVVSGKGGVGKSTIAALIAAKLSKQAPTLLLDFDICGPSIGNIFPASGKVVKTRTGLKPLQVNNSSLYILSMSSLIKNDSSVIWRAPRKLQLYEMFYNSAYENILQNTTESDPDSYDILDKHNNIGNKTAQKNVTVDESCQLGYKYVVIDTPPGITIVHSFIKEKNTKILLVTTSQNVAISDSINTINFFGKISGIIENMSGLKCPNCKKITNIYSRNGGSQLAEEFNIPFYGTLEIDQNISQFIENGTLYENINSLGCNNVLDTVVRKLVGS
ncbi:putative ATPase, partial [Trachipleistophora hominis]